MRLNPSWKELARYRTLNLKDAVLSRMQALPTVTGVQSLRSITARSSSARVLDLHSLALDAGRQTRTTAIGRCSTTRC